METTHLSPFELGMVAGTRRTRLSVSRIATLNSFPCVSRMVHHPKDIQPTWHNSGKHWSQHGPASLWKVSTSGRVQALKNWRCSEGKNRCSSILGRLNQIKFYLSHVCNVVTLSHAAVCANLVKNYRKHMISVIANKGFCTKYSAFLMYQILMACSKMQINYLKIMQCDFLDFCFRFRLSQLKCTYDKKNYRPLHAL